MPTILWAALSFLSGVIISIFFLFVVDRNIQKRRVELVRISDVKEAFYSDLIIGKRFFKPEYIDRRIKTRDVLLVIIAFCISFMLFLTALGQAWNGEWSFSLESNIYESRILTVFTLFVFGLFVPAYEKQISALWLTILRTLPGEGTNVAWPVQSVAAFSILIVVLSFIYPDLLRKLTSFKAGEIEAHFGDSSVAIRNAPVNILDARRKSSIKNWSDFQYGMSSDDADFYIYKIAGGISERRESATMMFKLQFEPLFKAASCLEDHEKTWFLRDEAGLKSLTMSYENLIVDSIGGHIALASQLEYLHKIIFIKTDDIYIKLIDFIRQEISQESLARNGDCKTAYESINKIIDEGGLYSEHKKIDHLLEKIPPGHSLWDPFLINAVADMIAFVENQREKAGFLEIVAPRFLDRQESCAEDCIIPTLGRLSLIGALTNAKVLSERPWPLDPIVDTLNQALSDIDLILASPNLKQDKISNKIYTAIQNRFRRNRIIDLSQGLSIYYQKVLSGEKISQRHLLQWRSWLNELKYILSVLDPGGVGFGFIKESAENQKWRDVKSFIVDRSADTFQDAATSAAISVVLLARQTGDPSASECNDAKAIYGLAANQSFKNYSNFLKLKADDIAAYQGFLTQVKNRIDLECATQ